MQGQVLLAEAIAHRTLEDVYLVLPNPMSLARNPVRSYGAWYARSLPSFW